MFISPKFAKVCIFILALVGLSLIGIGTYKLSHSHKYHGETTQNSTKYYCSYKG